MKTNIYAKLKIIFILTLLLTGCRNVEIQDTDSVPEINYSFVKGSIDDTSLSEIIMTLTSEAYDGRLTGTAGNDLAQDYIVDAFKQIGLESQVDAPDFKQSYTQNTIINHRVPTLETVSSTGSIVDTFKFGGEFRAISLWQGLKINGDVDADIIEITDLTSLNADNTELSGKVLLISSSLLGENGDAVYNLLQSVLRLKLDIKGIILGKDNRHSSTYIVSTSLGYVVDQSPEDDFNNENGPVMLYCIDTVYQALSEASRKGEKVNISLDYEYKTVETANIIGIIEGKDEKLKNETIFISAHLDHVGNNGDGTFNPGALDNASGIAGLLEIAKLMKSNEQAPDRTLVFVVFNGEEQGMFGSRYYVNHPLYDLKTSKIINLDMIGSPKEIPLTIASRFSKQKKAIEKMAQMLEISVVTENEMASDHTWFNAMGYDGVTLIHYDLEKIHTVYDVSDNVDISRMHDPLKLVLYYLNEEAYE